MVKENKLWKRKIFDMKMLPFIWGLLILFLNVACKKNKQKVNEVIVKPEPSATTSEYPASKWTASYDKGEFAFESKYRAYRKDRTVGIFYFLWIGAHGYDTHQDHNDVQVPLASDVKSPYDNNLLLAANPANPQYGPVSAFHHWGKPFFDYYVSNDRWVIRKHAQLLSDVGVDVIFIDVTNGYHYLPIVNTLCEEYMAMRKEGRKTPQISFVLNSGATSVLENLYTNIYLLGKYKELWYIRSGKPFLLFPDEAGMPRVQKSFFSSRYSWFDSQGSWFGDGMNKWTWGDLYPQGVGKAPSAPNEQISVLAATHPTSNIGRSHDGASQPSNVTIESSKAGNYFKRQTERALSVDPDFVFITGWNEWIAMRFNDGAAHSFLGKPIQKGDTYFVDQYNHEYSRDLEPVDGALGDVYYYYMADFIRKYKGVVPVAADKINHTPVIDASFEDWKAIANVYTDDNGDITARNHHGYGRIKGLTNTSGRNDIIETRVTADATNLYFYVKTAAPITDYKDPSWMRLFIQVNAKSDLNWEGFNFVVNNKVNSATATKLARSLGGWQWEDVQDINYRLSGNQMELAIPLTALGISGNSGYYIDFKWVDNAVSSGNIMECMSNGDSAPNSRFRYRYIR